MPTFTIDLSGTGGLASRFYGNKPFDRSNGNDFNHQTRGGSSQYARGICNPIAKLGYLSPANGTFREVTSTNDSQDMYSSQVDSINSRLYFMQNATIPGGTARLYKSNGDFSVTSLTIERTLASNTAGRDLAIYVVNGSRRLFYSYQVSTTGGDIGIFDFASSFDDTWLSASVSGAFSLNASKNYRLIPSDNGFMYVLDGPDVHRIDGNTSGGANGTVVPRVLAFPAFFDLIDGIDFRGNLWLLFSQSTRNINSGSGASTESFEENLGVYIWDRFSSVTSQADYIPISGAKEARAILIFRGQPHVFTVASSTHAQLRKYNGSEFEVIKELGFGDYPRFPKSVDVVDDRITWVANNGNIYAYGRIDPEQSTDELYHIGDISGLSGFAYPGAIANAGAAISASFNTSETVQETLWISTKRTSGEIMHKWFPHSVDVSSNNQNPNQGNVYTLVHKLPKLSDINGMTVYYPPTPTSGAGSALTIKTYYNQSSTSDKTIVLSLTDGTRGYTWIPLGKKGINQVQLEFEWPTATLMRQLITPSSVDLIINKLEERKK